MNTLGGKRWSLKWIATGLLAMSILGAESGFTSTTKPNPAHRSENTNDALQSPHAINRALDRYFSSHHIWHGPLPLLPETLGVSTVINPKYPHSFVVNLVYSEPSALNSPKTTPNVLPLADLWGDYARTSSSLARKSRLAYLSFSAPEGLKVTDIPAPLTSWHRLVPRWQKTTWVDVHIAAGISGYYTSNSGYGSAIVWHQNEWWLVMQGMLGRSETVAVENARALSRFASSHRVLSGQGTLLVEASGDGAHTTAAWQSGGWNYTIGNAHSTNQALTMVYQWMKAIQENSRGTIQ